ncbi:serine/arginine repetitive matrix protein 1-like [Cydia pomonella]|uniref:serine/arginine repetitive matrix protein 1-like n=1 Tax=Cydia pomonella TaxID=82600 RepID=UPI002ADDB0DB|nr:serine/arginine repetitive matrix protein 1-like [Cydia pomonella]
MSDNEDLLADDLGDHSLADYNLGNEEEDQLLADDYESGPQNVPTSIDPNYNDGSDISSSEFSGHGMPYIQQPYQPPAEECVVPNITVEVPNIPDRPIQDRSTYAPYEPPVYEPEHAVVPPAIPAAPIESPQIVPSELSVTVPNGENRERFLSERPPGAQRTPQLRDIPDSLDKVFVPRGGYGGARGRTSWRSAQFQARFPPPYNNAYRRHNLHRGNFLQQRPSFPPPQVRPTPPQIRPEPRPEQIRPDIGPDQIRPPVRHEQIRPDIRPDNRPRPEMRPEPMPPMGPEISPERPIIQEPFRPMENRPPFQNFQRFPFRPNMEEPRPNFGPIRPNYEPRFFQRPLFNPRPFGPPVREVVPNSQHMPQITIRQPLPGLPLPANVPKLDEFGPKPPGREPEVRMLPVQLPPTLPGALAGKKVLINPHFKGNFQPPVEATMRAGLALPTYIPTRIQKSPPLSPTLENKFGPIKDIDDAAERFIAEQRNALARAANRKFPRRSPQRYIENTTIEIENELAPEASSWRGDDDLLRRQEEFINANRQGLRRRMRSPTPPRRSPPPPPPRHSPERRRADRPERPERPEPRRPPDEVIHTYMRSPTPPPRHSPERRRADRPERPERPEPRRPPDEVIHTYMRSPTPPPRHSPERRRADRPERPERPEPRRPPDEVIHTYMRSPTPPPRHSPERRRADRPERPERPEPRRPPDEVIHTYMRSPTPPPRHSPERRRADRPEPRRPPDEVIHTYMRSPTPPPRHSPERRRADRPEPRRPPDEVIHTYMRSPTPPPRHSPERRRPDRPERPERPEPRRPPDEVIHTYMRSPTPPPRHSPERRRADRPKPRRPPDEVIHTYMRSPTPPPRHSPERRRADRPEPRRPPDEVIHTYMRSPTPPPRHSPERRRADRPERPERPEPRRPPDEVIHTYMRSPTPPPRHSPERRRADRPERPERPEPRRPPDEESEYRRRVREQESLRERVLRAKEVRRRKNAVQLHKQLQDKERERNETKDPKPDPTPESKPVASPDKPSTTSPELDKPDTTRSSPERKEKSEVVKRDRSPVKEEEAEVNSTCENLTPPCASPSRALTPPLPALSRELPALSRELPALSRELPALSRELPALSRERRCSEDDDLAFLLGDIDDMLSDDEDSGRFKEKPNKEEVAPPKPALDLRSKLPPRPPRQKIVFDDDKPKKRREKSSPAKKPTVTSSTKIDTEIPQKKVVKPKQTMDPSTNKSRQRIIFENKELEKEKEEDKSKAFTRRVVLQRKVTQSKEKSVFSRIEVNDPSKPNPGIFSRAVRTAIGSDKPRIVLKRDEPEIEYDSGSDDERLLDQHGGLVAAVSNLPHGMTDTRLKTLAGSDVQSLILDKEDRSAKITFKSTVAAGAFRKKFNNKMVAASRLTVTLL